MAETLTARPPAHFRVFPAGRRVRAWLGGELAADTRDPLLVWEPGSPVPIWAFPEQDVLAALEPTEPPQGPRPAQVAEAWDVRSGERVAHKAAWRYDDPDLSGHVALRFAAMDRWAEEDQEVFVHPRDPFHRVDVRESDRHVVVELDGEVLADSHRPRLLYETGLPVRAYLPREDVRMDLLEDSSRVTQCPYKGTARHWHARVGDERHDDVAWSYEDPLEELPAIKGLIAFYDEKTDVTVDGARQERPQTQWSLKPAAS
jgi:uncharacterized protein (DUF427 family)